MTISSKQGAIIALSNVEHVNFKSFCSGTFVFSAFSADSKDFLQVEFVTIGTNVRICDNMSISDILDSNVISVKKVSLICK